MVDLSGPMRLNTANDEVHSDETLQVVLRSPMLAVALVMKGCLNVLPLGRWVQEEVSFEWRNASNPVRTSPDEQVYELDVENFVPVFTVGSSSSSSRVCAWGSQGNTYFQSGGDLIHRIQKKNKRRPRLQTWTWETQGIRHAGFARGRRHRTK